MLRYPTQTPRLREVFDLRLVGVVACLVLTGIVSCDLVNRALDQKLSPQPAVIAPESFQPNSKATIVLALKTQDAERHTCAAAAGVNNDALHCEYENQKRRFTRANRPADDNLVDVLQPYKLAPGNHTVLLSGIWHMPEIAYRRHQEPARDRRKDQLQTFYVECDVEFFERLNSVDVRYEYGKAWANVKDVPTGRVTRCTISKDPNAPSI